MWVLHGSMCFYMILQVLRFCRLIDIQYFQKFLRFVDPKAQKKKRAANPLASTGGFDEKGAPVVIDWQYAMAELSKKNGFGCGEHVRHCQGSFSNFRDTEDEREEGTEEKPEEEEEGTRCKLKRCGTSEWVGKDCGGSGFDFGSFHPMPRLVGWGDTLLLVSRKWPPGFVFVFENDPASVFGNWHWLLGVQNHLLAVKMDEKVFCVWNDPPPRPVGREKSLNSP